MPSWPTCTPCPRPMRRRERRPALSRPTPRARLRALALARALAGAVPVLGLGIVGTALLATPAFASGTASSLSSVIGSLTTWLVGILAGLATLFLTIGGIRYLSAGGDPAQVERAKVALKSAAIGYALAALAPLLVSILQSVVGG